MSVGKRLVEEMAKAVVDSPEEVQVEEISGMRGTILKLRVAPDNVGQIIGRQGRLANAMRVILGAVSAKEDRWLRLEIME